jgi:hypothetical protein
MMAIILVSTLLPAIGAAYILRTNGKTLASTCRVTT